MHHAKIPDTYIDNSTPAELFVCLNIIAAEAAKRQSEYDDKSSDNSMPAPPQGIA
jgi:hypothetical protein